MHIDNAANNFSFTFPFPITEQNVFRIQLSKAFKVIFHQKLNFYNKSNFYCSFKQSWVIKNSIPVLEKIEKINWKANAKAISIFDFSTLYTKLSHFDLINALNKIIHFTFNSPGLEVSIQLWVPNLGLRPKYG